MGEIPEFQSHLSRKRLLFVLAIGITMLIAAWKIAPTLVLSGEVNAAMQRKSSWLVKLPGPLFVKSGGGNADIARSIAERIRNHDKAIYILDDCSSACAEFFIPAARKVYASDKAVIGYHVSEFWLPYFEGDTAKQTEICGYANLLWLRQVYGERHLKAEFSKEVIKRLGAQPVYGMAPPEPMRCRPPFYASLRARMWYPTSQQLSQKLGLNIGHAICADNSKCAQTIIDREPFARPKFRGEAIVIGEVLYPMAERP